MYQVRETEPVCATVCVQGVGEICTVHKRIKWTVSLDVLTQRSQLSNFALVASRPASLRPASIFPRIRGRFDPYCCLDAPQQQRQIVLSKLRGRQVYGVHVGIYRGRFAAAAAFVWRVQRGWGICVLQRHPVAGAIFI